MERSFKFTRARIAKLSCPKSGRQFYKDSDYPRLLLQVISTGAKSFYFRYWDPLTRYTSRVHLGRFPDLLPDDARRKAIALANDLANGKDPATKKRQARAEMTFQRAFESCIEHPRSTRPRRQITINNYEQVFRNHLTGSLSKRKLNAISRTLIEGLHERIGSEAGKIVANRTLKLISCVFNDAIRKGWEGQNPCTGLVYFKEPSRDRFFGRR